MMGPPPPLCLFQLRQRPRPAFDGNGAPVPGRPTPTEPPPVRSIVIDDEGPHIANARELERRWRLRGRFEPPELDGEMERASLAHLAFDPDAAPHHLHQHRRDREPQPRAAILARGGGIDLGEAVEDHFLLFGRYADAGVLDKNAGPDSVL